VKTVSTTYFSVEKANKLIPAFMKELKELKKLQFQFDDKFKELESIKKTDGQHVQTDTDKVFKIESELEFLEIQAQLHVSNIQDTGAQLKGIDPGLIDFPSKKENKDILLCWKEGEEEITHYHTEEEGFAGRKPLDEL
jgi:hypothetical protein